MNFSSANNVASESIRRMMAETSQRVHCALHARSNSSFFVCFVEMSWRADPSDGDSVFQNVLRAFAYNTMRGIGSSSLSDDLKSIRGDV